MHRVNIVIPSITVDSRLIRCLHGIEKLNYKNYFVTLVLDNSKNISLTMFYSLNVYIHCTNLREHKRKYLLKLINPHLKLINRIMRQPFDR